MHKYGKVRTTYYFTSLSAGTEGGVFVAPSMYAAMSASIPI